LAAVVRAKVPGAQIDFKPDPHLQPIRDKLFLPIGDRHARED
jgi:hypothetical protein